MASIYDWSKTPATNSTADSAINWQEGQPPNTVNNSARQMMARQKEFIDDMGAVAAGGTANAITVTLSSAVTSYFDGLRFSFKAASSNTGSATINVNAIGAKTAVLFEVGSERSLVTGNIMAGCVYDAVYLSSLNSAAGGWLIKNATGPTSTVQGPQLQGQLYGLTLSNNASDATNDIDIAAGSAAADTSPYYLMQLGSALTKRLDAAWAVGTGNGGLDTGSVANATYYIWLIQRSDTGVVDALFSLSSTAPTMPTSYDRKRLIGFLVRASATNGVPSNIGKPDFTYSGGAPLAAARAWVNFNGTGTVAIRASMNVSSVTDNGVGDYTVNFATAMADANYAVALNNSAASQGVSASIPATFSVGSFRFGTVVGTSSADPVFVCVAIFR